MPQEQYDERKATPLSERMKRKPLFSQTSYPHASAYQVKPEDIAEVAHLEAISAELLGALEGLLSIHTVEMTDAGFNPPVCKCDLCTAGTEAIRKASR